MTDDFDLDGIGITLDDLDLDYDLPPLPLDRPRYRPKGWWTTTEGEAFHLDLPDFDDGAQRARFMVDQMARAVSDDPDAVVLPYAGRMVSRNELLSLMDDEAMGLDGLR